MRFFVRDVSVPADARPTPVIEGLAEVDRQAMVDFFGHDDLVDPAAAQARHYASQEDTEKWWLALQDDAGLVVGGAAVALPRRDNLWTAELEVTLAPGIDVAAGVNALWQELAPRLAAAGRTSVQWWQMHRDGGQAPADSRLVAATGSGAVVRDEWTAALTSLGFVLEQVERHSVLAVADHRDSWPALTADAQSHAAGYELITWQGVTPEPLRAPMARLRNRMSIDVPHGALDIEEQVWDVDRVVRSDEVSIAKGRTSLYAVARHRTSGEVVAYTVLELPDSKPAVGWQDDTLVHADHRGHRLGMLVKTANLAQLARVRPQVERVHTWNADENQWMLAINVALGFRPVSAEGAWQRTAAAT